jgi:NUMOD4 motif/HNH endonuclease
MEQEIWKPIQGYEGLYEISNFGRAKSLIKGIIMTITLHETGYCVIGLTKNNKQRVFRFHRIVASHFCDKKEGCDVVNHKNGIKTDNRALNLEWTTVSGNTSHSFAMGLQKPRTGEESNFAVLSEKDIIDIRDKYRTKKYTQKELGILFGVSRTAITLIVNRKRWAHIQ